jgi:hypothetical protein
MLYLNPIRFSLSTFAARTELKNDMLIYCQLSSLLLINLLESLVVAYNMILRL